MFHVPARLRKGSEWGLRAVDEDRDPYAMLGVTRTATQTDVEAANKRLIPLTHPDAGGSDRMFREVQEARVRLALPDGEGQAPGDTRARPSSEGLPDTLSAALRKQKPTEQAALSRMAVSGMAVVAGEHLATWGSRCFA
jgi:curved DNA-binding protein CbpA